MTQDSFRIKVQDFTNEYIECFIMDKNEQFLIFDDRGEFKMSEYENYNPKYLFKINWVRNIDKLVLKKPNLSIKEISKDEKSLIEVLKEEKLNKSHSDSRYLMTSAHSRKNR